MKFLRNLYKTLLVSGLCLVVISCNNQDIEFADYEGGTTVYFAYQYPVRTIVLGEDTYDTSLDNEHRCEIYATIGGLYSNKNKVNIDFVVDESLCKNLFFEDGSPVEAMPSNYYTLGGKQIVLDKAMMGAVGVQLQDAFFADPKALSKTYVIPLLMTNVENADRMLTGRRLVEDAPRTFAAGWDIQPQDYVLYCLKFINSWDGNYLRRGVDQITENGVTTTKVRRAQTVEKDEVSTLKTTALNMVNYSISTDCDLTLTFNDKNECTISTKTKGATATGSGKFVKQGEKNSWGNKDRNVLYLEYQIDLGTKKYVSKDTLVVRDRGIAAEWFSPTYKQN